MRSLACRFRHPSYITCLLHVLIEINHWQVGGIPSNFFAKKNLLRAAHSTQSTHHEFYYSCWQQQESDLWIPTFTRIFFPPQPSFMASLISHFPVAPVRNTWIPLQIDACTDSTSFFSVTSNEALLPLFQDFEFIISLALMISAACYSDQGIHHLY